MPNTTACAPRSHALLVMTTTTTRADSAAANRCPLGSTFMQQPPLPRRFPSRAAMFPGTVDVDAAPAIRHRNRDNGGGAGLVAAAGPASQATWVPARPRQHSAAATRQ